MHGTLWRFATVDGDNHRIEREPVTVSLQGGVDPDRQLFRSSQANIE